MTYPISVVIPVGPLPRHKENLRACVASAWNFNHPDEIIIIENGCEVTISDLPEAKDLQSGYAPVRRHKFDEGQSIAEAFNEGVKVASNELVFLLGSDDIMLPHCIQKCFEAWEGPYNQASLGWYYVGCVYSNGFTQNTPCLAAMVTKSLWSVAGPLNPNFSPYPACEIEYISRLILSNGQLGSTYRVSDEVLYFVRLRDGYNG